MTGPPTLIPPRAEHLRQLRGTLAPAEGLLPGFSWRWRGTSYKLAPVTGRSARSTAKRWKGICKVCWSWPFECLRAQPGSEAGARRRRIKGRALGPHRPPTGRTRAPGFCYGLARTPERGLGTPGSR